jgi:glycosyltransferase involved in cell wall biosynthesis
MVSILTPVYNGETYLNECIKSVLAQTYRNFEYIILDNFSSDRTSQIVEEYAKKDSRIRVYRNDELLPIIANHNKAFSLVDKASRYCKVVSADDFLFPECVARMVELAETNSEVGIVGSYQMCGDHEKGHVRNYGLPLSKTIVPGVEICRSQMLGTLSVFGNPTSTLYRADLVRSTDAFYPNKTAEADTSACFNALKQSDFGFVHQVLSYERVHYERMTTVSQDLNAYLSSSIGDCLTYGCYYLSRAELDRRIQELLHEYYGFLAASTLRSKSKSFWAFHERRFEELGLPLDKKRIYVEAAVNLAKRIYRPKSLFESVKGRVRRSQGARIARANKG